MQRVRRQPSKFGAVDLADQVGQEYNLPLHRLSEKFSFKIVRLTPQLEPAALAPSFDDSYRGETLRLWQFEIEPNRGPVVNLKKLAPVKFSNNNKIYYVKSLIF